MAIAAEASDPRPGRARQVRGARPGLVGRCRADGAAAQAQPGPRRLHPRPGLPPSRARPGTLSGSRWPGCASSTSAAAAACWPSRWPGWAPRSPASIPCPSSIEAARWHAEEAGLEIDYEAATLETSRPTAASASTSCWRLEVVEHVPDVPLFLAALAAATRPGGLVVLSTLSRTPAQLPQGHRRRGVPAGLAAARHPRLAPLPHARPSSPTISAASTCAPSTSAASPTAPTARSSSSRAIQG